MVGRKVYEMLFQLNAQLGGNYQNIFNKAQREIIATQKEIDALNKVQSDISSYQKQQTAVEASRKKLETLQQQYDNIQREINETGSYSSALENKLISKQQQIDKTTASMSAQTSKLEQMRNGLRDAGVDTENLTGETARLGNQIDELRQRQEEAAEEADNFGSIASTAFIAVGQALAAAGITLALKEIADYYKICIDASMEFETAMAGVRRTVGGNKEEITALGTEFKDLSTDIPIVTTELGKIAETAGQLGISRDVVYEFTEVMAMLATTTDLTADTAATMLAQFANITGLTDYERLGAAVAELGDATATTASKVVEMSQGMAAAASIAGFSETDILAVSAAVGSLGIESQAGSTAMSTLISILYKAVETGSEKLTDFASVAGMSADEFSAAWRDDAVRAMDAFVKGLNDTERNGKSAIVILDELGITNVRQTKAILGLASAGDLLSNTITRASNAWEENTALQAKAGIMYDTTQSQLVMMQNAYNNLKIAIGDNFTPVLSDLYSAAADVLDSITKFVEEHPELVKAIASFTGALLAGIAALTTYATVLKVVIPLLKLFTAAMPGVNGIMTVVAGVAVLTAGIMALVEASKKQTNEAWKLTAASREQYNKIQELNEEYDRTSKTYGETSREAQSLRGEIEYLTAEYEAGKQSLEEYKAAHDKLMSSYEEMTSSHTNAYEEIEKEQRSTMALIAKLEELTSIADGAATNQQAILSIIEALNEEVPELALSYDDVVNSSAGFIDSLYDIAKAQAAQLLLEEQWKEYINHVKNHDALKSAKEAAEYNAKIAQEEYDIAYKAWSDAMELSKYDIFGSDAGKEAKALAAAREQLEYYNEALDESSIAYEENTAKIEELDEAYRSYQKAQEEAAATGENIREIITSTKKQMDELSVAYEEAYKAALDSISGQYKLWDEAAGVVATSAGEINNALESQAKYWKDYNENLAKLTERSADIEGLSEMIASFADGSEGSVNAVAGMARATDKELEAMVSNWQALQSEQKTVAESLAKLETDFAAAMDALQTELEDTIADMNLSEEAAEKGKNTIQGFINGAEDMLPAVQAAYTHIANVAAAAIDERLQIRSPSKVLEHSGENTVLGFNIGAERMLSETQNVMRTVASSAVNTFADQKVKQIITVAPWIQEAYSKHMALGGERKENTTVNKITSTEYTEMATPTINNIWNYYKEHDTVIDHGISSIPIADENGKAPITLAKVTAFEAGTLYAPDMYIAGEKGPELILGAKGSSVFPTTETMKILSAIESQNSSIVSEKEVSAFTAKEIAALVSSSEFQQYVRDTQDERFDRISEQYYQEHENTTIQSIMPLEIENVTQVLHQGVNILPTEDIQVVSHYPQIISYFTEIGGNAENDVTSTESYNAFNYAFSTQKHVTNAVKDIADTTPITLAKVTAFEAGALYAPDMYIAGEKGPELILGAKGSSVFPTTETMKILSAIESQNSSIVSEKEMKATIVSDEEKVAAAIIDIQNAEIYQQYFINGNYAPGIYDNAIDMSGRGGMVFADEKYIMSIADMQRIITYKAEKSRVEDSQLFYSKHIENSIISSMSDKVLNEIESQNLSAVLEKETSGFMSNIYREYESAFTLTNQYVNVPPTDNMQDVVRFSEIMATNGSTDVISTEIRNAFNYATDLRENIADMPLSGEKDSEFASLQNNIVEELQQIVLTPQIIEKLEAFPTTEDMLPAIQTEYAHLSEVATIANDERFETNSLSTLMEHSNEYVMDRFADTFEATESKIMSTVDNAYINAITSEYGQLMGFDSQMMPYLNVLGAGANTEVVSAEHNGGGISITIQYSPQYEITGISNEDEIRSILHEHDNNLRDFILEVLEDAEIDGARRAFA